MTMRANSAVRSLFTDINISVSLLNRKVAIIFFFQLKIANDYARKQRWTMRTNRAVKSLFTDINFSVILFKSKSSTQTANVLFTQKIVERLVKNLFPFQRKKTCFHFNI